MNTNKSDDTNPNKPTDNDTYTQDIADLENKSNTSTKSPNKRGSQSVSGSNASPGSDDDVLENAHQIGIATDADLENPKPLNLAKDVADAEEYRRTH